MLAALAGFVHHRKCVDGDEHNRDKDNAKGLFIVTSRPQPFTCRIFVV
jgi:hypothetical protein